MLLIGTPLSATHWRIFIQRWRYFMCQDWSHCGSHFFPLFRRWQSRSRKYLARGMICVAWLSLPTRGSILSVFIFVEARDSMISFTQAFSFYFVRNTLREQIWMYQPRYVLCLTSQPSPTSLRSKRGLSHFSCSEGYSGLNMVWMTNKADFWCAPPNLGHQW